MPLLAAPNGLDNKRLIPRRLGLFSFGRDYSLPVDRLSSMAVLLLVVLMLSVLEKLFTGTGQQVTGSKLIVQTQLQVVYDRVIVGIIFLLALFVAVRTGASKGDLKFALVLWMPLLLLLLLRIPYFEGEVDVMFRTMSFITCIVTSVFLAISPGVPALFLRHLFFVTLVANVVGLVLYAIGEPFSYFTDGYGVMFTGVFAHKGKVSDAAAFGFIIGLLYLSRERRLWLWVAVSVQLLTLFMAATVSGLLGTLVALASIVRFRTTVVLASLFSITLPLLYPIYGALAEMIGKDPTLTGRTLLWEYGIAHGLQAPIFGHGFSHISSTLGWNEMLMREFESDTFFIPHTHNLWVETFDKFGVIGLAVMVWILTIRLWAVPIPRPRTLTGVAARALAAALIMKSALTLPFLTTDVTAYLWVLFLTIAVMDNRFAKRRAR